MKKIFILSIIILSSAIAFGQLKVDDVIIMDIETHNFGKVKQSVPATCVFFIKNISNKIIQIEQANASSGSLIVEKPDSPFIPGKGASLRVQFNATRVGPFEKEVYIKIAWVDGVKVVRVKGEVLTPEDYEEWQRTKPKGQ